MGRGKVEMKRIENKSSRQVSFSKRRNGLMKKAHELAILCDVDLALFVFSGKNRLFEYSTGDSMTEILGRYQSYKNADEIVRRTVHEKLGLEGNNVWTADKLMQITQSHLEEHRIQQLDISELCQLEKRIESMIQLVKMKKTEVMLGTVKALQEKQKQLLEEKQFMVEEIMAARMNENNVDG